MAKQKPKKKKGFHRMPDGSLMANEDMPMSMPRKKTKKRGGKRGR